MRAKKIIVCQEDLEDRGGATGGTREHAHQFSLETMFDFVQIRVEKG